MWILLKLEHSEKILIPLLVIKPITSWLLKVTWMTQNVTVLHMTVCNSCATFTVSAEFKKKTTAKPIQLLLFQILQCVKKGETLYWDNAQPNIDQHVLKRLVLPLLWARWLLLILIMFCHFYIASTLRHGKKCQKFREIIFR